MTLPWAVLLGYLLGSIPFGLLLTRAAGLGDIRRVGSGNIGATNVLRTGNKGLAAAVLVLDMAKGAAAVLLTVSFGPAAAFAAVVGHCFPVWLRFRGGKGVATALGAIAGLAWPAGLAAAAIWLVTAALSRISSLSALIACGAAPLLMWAIRGGWPALATLAIALLVVLRHHANIRRLLAGTEPKIGR